MIHIQESDKRKIDTDALQRRLHDARLDPPHYGIIASLDVSSAMMEGASSRAIVQETHDEAMHFAARRFRRRLKKNDWWFHIWQPGRVDGPPATADWVLEPEGRLARLRPRRRLRDA